MILYYVHRETGEKSGTLLILIFKILGLRINSLKSSLVGINMEDEKVSLLTNSTNCEVVSFLINFLGLLWDLIVEKRILGFNR